MSRKKTGASVALLALAGCATEPAKTPPSSAPGLVACRSLGALLDGREPPVVDAQTLATWRAAPGRDRPWLLGQINETLVAERGMIDLTEGGASDGMKDTWLVCPVLAPGALPEDLLAALAALDGSGDAAFDAAGSDVAALASATVNHPFAARAREATRRLGELLVESGAVEDGAMLLDRAVALGVEEARASRDAALALLDADGDGGEIFLSAEEVWSVRDGKVLWEYPVIGFAPAHLIVARPNLVVIEGTWHDESNWADRTTLVALGPGGRLRWRLDLATNQGESPFAHAYLVEHRLLFVTSGSETFAVETSSGECVWRVRHLGVRAEAPVLRLRAGLLDDGSGQLLDARTGRAWG
jgi:hypothetical protein